MANTFDGQLWWLGVIMAILGNLIDAIAYLLEKKSHIKIQEDIKKESGIINSENLTEDTNQVNQHHAAEESVSYLCSCRWWFGFGTHIVGACLFSFSLGFGDQALLSPLQSITIVFNTILSWKYLNERLNKIQIIGTILIVLGCAGVIAFGPKSEDGVRTAHDLQSLFRSLNFLLFNGAIILIALVDYIILKVIKPQNIKSKTFLLFSYVGQAAFYGSWNILFTKCVMEILASSTQGGGNATQNWSNWLTYMCIILLVVTMITLEYWRQESLKNFPANFVGSMYTILIIVGGICFAAVFFNEFQGMNPIYSVTFCAAVAISFVGVAMLAFGDKYGNVKPKHVLSDKYENIVNLQMDLNDMEKTTGNELNSGGIIETR